MTDQMNLHNSVRNCLMNELGLTRDSIREETEKIVRETVERRIDKLIVDGTLDRVIKKQIESLNGGQWNSPTVRSTILDQVSTLTKEWFEENITISAKGQDDT